VLTEPTQQGQLEPEVQFIRDQRLIREGRVAVRIQVRHVLETRLTRQQLLQDPSLKELSILKMAQGTNFAVTDAQAARLATLIPEVPEEEDAEAKLGSSSRSPEPEPLAPPHYVKREFSQIKAWFDSQRPRLRITDKTLRRYHLALESRRFVVLAGVSGTGKTWLTQAYARAIEARYLPVAVAPNWTTNEDLLGFQHPVSPRYQHTEFSLFLEEAAAEFLKAGPHARPFHLVLDEMNLARVEYYFAKFLSAMEFRARDGESSLKLASDKTVVLPPNLYFIGTINVDETTQGFADKVYDRAQLVELEVEAEDIRAHLEGTEYATLLFDIWRTLHEVAPFAYRVLDDIRTYVDAGRALGAGWQETLDEQLLQKILPKLKGGDSRVGRALQTLEQRLLEEPDGKTHFRLTLVRLHRMRAKLEEHGLTSYF